MHSSLNHDSMHGDGQRVRTSSLFRGIQLNISYRIAYHDKPFIRGEIEFLSSQEFHRELINLR